MAEQKTAPPSWINVGVRVAEYRRRAHPLGEVVISTVERVDADEVTLCEAAAYRHYQLNTLRPVGVTRSPYGDGWELMPLHAPEVKRVRVRARLSAMLKRLGEAESALGRDAGPNEVVRLLGEVERLVEDTRRAVRNVAAEG